MRISWQGDTKVVTLSPIEDMPFLSDWHRALWERGFGTKGESLRINPRTNKPYDEFTIFKGAIQPAIIDEHTNVGILCIGCGQPMFGEIHSGFGRQPSGGKEGAFKHDQITIGGFIQVKEERDRQPLEVTYGWKIMPVRKDGIGCVKCRAAFQEAIADTERFNRKLRIVVDVQHARAMNASLANLPDPEDIKKAMQAKCLHGMVRVFCAVCNRGKNPFGDVVTIKTKGEATPFLDVFEGRQL